MQAAALQRPEAERIALIRELLSADKIVFGLQGSWDDVLGQLLARSSRSDRVPELRRALATTNARMMASGGVAIPHARIDGLGAPELVLGLSRRGIAVEGNGVRVVLLLLTPTEEPAVHLQLLERAASLLPAMASDLVASRDAESALRRVGRGEDEGRPAAFLNLAADQIAVELGTSLKNGLTSDEAARRHALHGANILRRPRRVPRIVGLARNMFSFFAVLLWIAAALCFVPGVDMPQLGVAIMIVVIVNGVFAFLQESKSDRAVEALQRLMAPTCRVVRGGTTTTIAASQLVPGDVILLSEGDVVPADARLIEAFEVEVDNSTLTGESTSARRYKSDRPLLLTGKFLWIELPNIVFAGTAVVRGEARAVVFGTGMGTEVGKIAGATQGIVEEDTPLQRQLRSTVTAVAGLAAGLAVLFLLLGYGFAGLSFAQAFVFCIGMFVANVPEGLLPTVTLALAMGVTRLAERGVIVKRLSAVEALGSTTVICCDKTGTLTLNAMAVTEVHLDGRSINVSGRGARGEFAEGGATLGREAISRWPALRRLLECAVACNNAHLEHAGGGVRVVGDPTEGALLMLAEKAGLRVSLQGLALHPFDSVRKRMSVVVSHADKPSLTLYAKGAPLEILERCERIVWSGEVRELRDEDRKRIAADHDALARRGLRLLALTYRDLGERDAASVTDADRAERNLVFLGMTAMSDPIRPGVPEAIAACHAAGVRVLMLTGDYGLTAASIAETAGLGSGGAAPVTTGAELATMGDAEVRALLARGERVFARVSPEHKLRIVSVLKDMGEVVAVTGDGVNDAPALKKADIGIAMGLRGNDVAKEAADMVLTDDNFGSIVAAIEEGRGIFENIRRFAAYVLNSNPQEMYPYILWMLLPNVPLAMTVMGVLAVDVGTDLVPAMGLGMERPEKGLMQRPPRRKSERLLSLGFILRSYFVQGTLLALSCFATYLYAGYVLGFWRPGLGLAAMPPSPEGLRFSTASEPYLQTLTAYFFPTATTQIANVLCKRSWQTSLFSKEFLPREHRAEILRRLGLAAGRPIVGPPVRVCRAALERWPLLMNLVSNPLIDLGIAFALVLCALFFYSPLRAIYFFAPVPWHVYAFAFHGPLVLLAFEEAKKYLRRRGHRLEFLG